MMCIIYVIAARLRYPLDEPDPELVVVPSRSGCIIIIFRIHMGLRSLSGSSWDVSNNSSLVITIFTICMRCRALCHSIRHTVGDSCLIISVFPIRLYISRSRKSSTAD